MRLRLRTALSILAIVALAVAPSALATHNKSKRPKPQLPTLTCAYLELGPPGPAGNQLSISAGPNSAPFLSLDGTTIDVSGTDAFTCSGGTPTTSNIDGITVTVAGRFGGLDLDTDVLFGGATPENDGSSEIEMAVSPATTRGYVQFYGSRIPEHYLLGAAPNGTPGVNIGPASAGADTDIDVTISQGSFDIDAEEGNDLISGGGEAAVSGLFDDVPSLYGGDGNDTVLGTPGADYLSGGEGNDLVESYGGPDVIIEDTGADTIRAGAGADKILAAGRHKTIDCGAGRDRLAARKGTRFTGCERVRRNFKGFEEAFRFLFPKAKGPE